MKSTNVVSNLKDCGFVFYPTVLLIYAYFALCVSIGYDVINHSLILPRERKIDHTLCVCRAIYVNYVLQPHELKKMAAVL